MIRVAILGCGYTGVRVARRIASSGIAAGIVTTNRSTFDLWRGDSIDIPDGALVLHSIPLLQRDGEWARTMPRLGPMLAARAARVVYLSTTGIYGAAHLVDETTPPAPRVPRERLRVEEEDDVLAGPWKALVLRPAAIYGPGRGVHVSLREGKHRMLGDGSNFISRIHVDDLAAIAEKALFSNLTGAYPVADDEPCTAAEITAFTCGLLGIPAPPPSGKLPDADTRGADRKVDGRAIRRLLGVDLRFPGYRSGLPAAIAAEREGVNSSLPPSS